jgi:hypothetical protein
MNALELLIVGTATVLSAIVLGVSAYWMWTRPFPHQRRDRRERLPDPEWRARVYEPDKYSRWWS